jgi:hypothetical protein
MIAGVAFVAVPALLSVAIGSHSSAIRILALVPIFVTIPYVFFVVYRLFTQGMKASREGNRKHTTRLVLSFAGESKELAGAAGVFATIATVIAIALEVIH